ncbi:TPM domain-containing protein [Akkermansiaceae bacterium]|nr:TPM domain-containing protein [Akkermansiaceae bacterium]
MVHADEVFGAQDIKLRKFSDVAGVFRMKDREPMRKVLEDFETKFPQLFVSVYLGAFEDLNSLRQYGFWMLNRTHYVDVDPKRPNSTGILILVDVNAKSASITFGYALMPYLDENSTFEALSAGHPFFLQGDYLKALKAVIEKLETPLIKGWRRVRKNPIQVLGRGGADSEGEWF